MIDDRGSDLPVGPAEDSLFGDVTSLIEQARGRVAVTVNAELTMLYWGIGTRIREDVLGGVRADYGQQIVRRLAERLTERYGRGYSKVSLLRMVRFAEVYPEPEIVSTLWTQLTWSHCWRLIALQDADERRFYETLATREHWSVRTLEQQIQRRLYQRALEGRDPGDLAVDLADAAGGDAAPALLLRDPHVLDFLGLDHGEIRAARYITEPMRDEMRRRLIAAAGQLGAGRRSESDVSSLAARGPLFGGAQYEGCVSAHRSVVSASRARRVTSSTIARASATARCASLCSASIQSPG